MSGDRREHVEADNEGARLGRGAASPPKPAVKSAAKQSAAKSRSRGGGQTACTAEQQADAGAGDDRRRSSDSSSCRNDSAEAVSAVASAEVTAYGSVGARNHAEEPQPLQAVPQQAARRAAEQQRQQQQQPSAGGDAASQRQVQPSQQQTGPVPEQPRGQPQAAAPQQQKRRRRLGTNRALPASPDPEEEYGPSQRGGVDALGLPRARASKVTDDCDRETFNAYHPYNLRCTVHCSARLPHFCELCCPGPPTGVPDGQCALEASLEQVGNGS